jgi:hypothetical protein
MKLTRIGLWLCVLAIASLLVQTAVAQTVYGSLAGTVYDKSGAVIPNAEVKVAGISTGLVRTTMSDASGFWRISSLTPGQYRLEVTSAGFDTIVRAPLEVQPAVERALDTTLEPSATQQVITITEEAPLIEATRAQISKGVESQRILELPGLNALNGLALLMPGTTPNETGRPGSGFTVNGGRTRSNNFLLDGANNNDQSLAIPRQSLTPEYLGEFRMITNNFSAEFGRNAGSVVMQTTKQGTNDFHGIARWTWLGNGLNALTTAQQRTFSAQKAAGRTDYQALRAARGVGVQNQLVGSVGGPIVKNRTFFFAGYDTDRFRSTAVPITTTLSPEAFDLLTQNQGVFAAGTVDFLKRTYPVANDPTAQGSIAVNLPDGRRLTLPLQQFNRAAGGALSYARDFHRWLGRVDHRFSDKDQVQGRYLIDHQLDPGSPAPLEVNQIGSRTRNQNATINHVRVWSPTMVMETRLTYGRRAASFPENMPAAISLQGLPAIGNINFPQFRTDNLYEMGNNWSNMRSRHTLRWGFNYMQYRLNSFFAPLYRGWAQWPSFSDFLFDTNGEWQQYAGTGSIPAKTHEVAAYFGDDWRVTNSLTLNLGMRYEYTSTPHGFFSEAKPDINNFAPRSGFAYAPKKSDGFLGRLSGNGKMVIRGGYAISYDQVFQNVLLNTGRNFPRGVNVSLRGQPRLWDPASRPPAPTPELYVAQGNNPLLLDYRYFAYNRRVKQPYTQQFSFGIERQFGNDYAFKVFYIGTHGLNLVREVETNVGVFASAVNANPAFYNPIIQQYGMQPGRQGTRDMFRVNPNRGGIVDGDGLAQSNFQSVQFTLQKRFSRGLVFEGNYTWSTYISDADDVLGGQANRTVPSVPWAWGLDRARSGFDQPHRFVLNWVYQIPEVFGSKGVLGRVIDGWQISGIGTIAQGIPYSLLQSSTNALGIVNNAGLSTVHLSQRASFNPNGQLNTASSPSVSNPMWVFNPTDSGIIGAGANIRRVGTTNNWDAAMAKSVRTFGEQQSLQFRWELFNVFNHRNFNQVPANQVSANTNNTTFMNLGFTNVGGRTMQFSVRYLF